jgi:AraC family transcriptional regulator of arabinose operon
MVKPQVMPRAEPLDRILTGDFANMGDFTTVRPHGTSDWLIIHTIGGEAIITVEGRKYPVVPGDIVLSRPATMHHYRTNPRVGTWALLWAHFYPRDEWLDWLRWPVLAGGWGKLHFKSAVSKKIQDRLRQMHRYATQPQGFGRHEILAMNALEEVLLWCDAANESRRTLMDEPTQIVLDTISRHYAERLSLRRLAHTSGQSVARLTRQFRKYVGATTQAVIEQRRLERARQLLARTTLSVKEIAVQTGFASPFYFSIRFKAATGSSPRRYRNDMLKAQAARHPVLG